MTNSGDQPAITPDMKVAALLKDFPDLEEVLIDIAPAFKKLRNPVLRRTVAKITSLRQAARVGGVTIGEVVNRLRVAAGQEAQWEKDGEKTDATAERPSWVDDCEVEVFDARETIESGSHPLSQVLGAVNKLAPGQAYAIITPFLPAPMIDKVQAKGFLTWTDQKGPDHFVTYFSRA